jgi:hypothetical protein
MAIEPVSEDQWNNEVADWTCYLVQLRLLNDRQKFLISSSRSAALPQLALFGQITHLQDIRPFSSTAG